ncbi:hypothetical protein HanXRQr2_Chr05g0218981 [Helianthus annuus]|uniref:Uncharacterized protein n=1 Tax=Helianthus annuus TaxID=4232 RepID=A0A251UR45_HELAN|nr:hypothetical protein HanXRQr2_Chr05g0218981 [Helianthus annuus]KAJ0923073.1 hypothetical protein HanPSC8_Chr05g0211381 [Helianthus annuus]
MSLLSLSSPASQRPATPVLNSRSPTVKAYCLTKFKEHFGSFTGHRDEARTNRT